MVKLLIIADDLTGALDTGVQFAARGLNTRVVISPNYDFRELDSSVQVLAIDAETRHLMAKEAYDVVYDITKRAVALNIPYLYKKTDSALRGNIGSELTAMLDAAGGKILSFIPAFPKMRRWTKKGVHYIDGVPVSKSVFGKDPFEPVTYSHIRKIIGKQSAVKVQVKNLKDLDTLDGEREPEIIVWDAETDSELEAVGVYLYNSNQMYLTAGCAGFAEVLSKLLRKNGDKRSSVKLAPKLLAICGSVNPITAAQLDYAEKQGLFRYRLKAEEMLSEDFWRDSLGKDRLEQLRGFFKEHSCIILDSNETPGMESAENRVKALRLSTEEIRRRIVKSFGHILRAFIESSFEGTLFITGGDTLLGCMEELGVKEMDPICEVVPGAVLSEFSLKGKKYYVVSKSGGFGNKTFFIDLLSKLSVLQN